MDIQKAKELVELIKKAAPDTPPRFEFILKIFKLMAELLEEKIKEREQKEYVMTDILDDFA